MASKFRSTVCLLICLLGVFLSGGCDFLYRLLDKEGAQEKALIGDVVPFEKNLIVEEVQALLHIYGYNTGKIDGVLGLRTRNAVEKFQADNGLDTTRFVDEATWEKLNVFKENKLIVEGKLNIRFIQTLLKEAGFDPGNIDGKMGPRTKRIVLEFQEAHQLKVDGKIGYQTLSQLAAFITTETQDEQ